MKLITTLATILLSTTAHARPPPLDGVLVPLTTLPPCYRECLDFTNFVGREKGFDVSTVTVPEFCREQQAFFPRWDMDEITDCAAVHCGGDVEQHAAAFEWYQALCHFGRQKMEL
ncbi:hypothetical protein CkaCkLH20_09262 [Colletotrichum karsti]|uniref:Uncharacterized protein n=1 Tax=Colletotrichum karsti TaxID=1095194 RepID=A0A9P6HZ54_9PEZI|nr:uncharacterized protein CkaCkLH20_09262 [Colletotrichum karsti]KAF9873099.1 hypothetical protein CkaCkLH20_09262 [Colletotrichum karsti]